MEQAFHNDDDDLHDFIMRLLYHTPIFVKLMETNDAHMFNDMNQVVAKLLNLDIRIIQPKQQGFAISDGSYQPYLTENHVNLAYSPDAIYLYFDGLSHYDAALK